MPRYRFIVDAKTLDDIALTQEQLQEIAEATSTLMMTAGFEELNGAAKANLRVEPVAYSHQHESDRDNTCPYCVQAAKDRQNSYTGDPD